MRKSGKVHKKRLFIVILIVAVFLTGCWKTDDAQDINAHVPRKFGATYMTMNNPYFVVLNENIKEVVEANGDILITRDPLQDQEKQNQQIEEMIEAGVEAIFINPVDWKTVEPSLKRCQENGVALFNIDTNVYNNEYIVSTIISDNYNAGVQCARDMMLKRDEADIVILNHNNINSTQLRVQGFLDTIAGNDTFRVVEHRKTTAELEVAMEEMKDIINQGYEFDVVLGGNDPTALGCLSAMQLNHIDGDILLYGIDGSPDAKAMIKAGYMEGTSAQSPINIGRTAAETAYQYLDGITVAEEIKIPVNLITAKNLSEYDIGGWQ